MTNKAKHGIFNHLSCWFLIQIFLIIGGTGLHKRLLADQVLQIDELNPQVTNLGIFNSFKYRTIIIAITQKNTPPFDCHANRYILYNYGKEDYLEIEGGNLKVNSDYSKLIAARIHSSVGTSTKNDTDSKQTIRTIRSILNVSNQTLEQGKSISTDKTVSCWQQPEIIDLSTRSRKPVPFLLANLCQQAWCSELFWTDLNHVRFWVQTKPKELHMVRLNTKTGDYRYQNKSPKYFLKTFMQLNAPRDNLVTSKNKTRGSFVLRSKAGSHISVLWKARPDKRIRVELIRAKEDKKAGARIRKQIVLLIAEKKYTDALRLLNFGFWLTPDDTDLKFEKLRVFASLALTSNFFKSLQDDFSKEERFSICKKLHVDSALTNLWKQDHFSASFKKTCL